MNKKLWTSGVAARTVVAALLAAPVLAEDLPQISGVTMAQTAGSCKVNISYTLANAPAIVTLSITTNGIALPDSAVTHLTGDVCKLIQPGEHSIVWQAKENWPAQQSAARAVVTAWYTKTPPPYCAVDLGGGTNADSYPVYYYPSAEGVPGGVTDNAYKSEFLLLRQVPATDAAGFRMGSPSTELYRNGNETLHYVVLTNSFYIGVYPVTQYQWWLVYGTQPAQFKNAGYWMMRPIENVGYSTIRGSSAGAGWPNSSAVDDSSFLGLLRAKSGLTGFDLPTEAEWEYACRAGSLGALNDGTENITNPTDDNLAKLGRYANNGGKINGKEPDRACTPSNGTAIVGSYLPNAWGLYDTQGNVFEWCRDWFGPLGTAKVTNPPGAASGTVRVMKGGCWTRNPDTCRIAFRNSYSPTGNVRYGDGLRLFCAIGD